MPIASQQVQSDGLDPEAIAQLRLVVLRLARQIRQHADAGVTPSQLSALTTIRRHGPMRLGGVAAQERVGKSRVTKLVARLENLGLIHRVQDPTDARCSLVELTPRGRALLADITQKADVYLARQVAALDPTERQRLADMMPLLASLLEANS